MSLRGITWAFDQHDTTPTQRLLLLALSDHANHDNETWPSVKTLEAKTGFTKSTIYRERTALCDRGKLTRLARDKYRINIEIVPEEESDSQSGKEIPTPGKALNKGTPNNPQGTAAADDEQRLWTAYIELVRDGDYGRLPRTIPASYRRDAKACLADFSLNSLLVALRGFVNYRRKKAGSTRFSDIFGTHIRQSRTERVEFWIEQAGDASPIDGFPSAAREKILRAVRDVQRAFGSKDPDTQATGAEAVEYLKSIGIKLVPREKDGYPILPARGGRS